MIPRSEPSDSAESANELCFGALGEADQAIDEATRFFKRQTHPC